MTFLTAGRLQGCNWLTPKLNLRYSNKVSRAFDKYWKMEKDKTQFEGQYTQTPNGQNNIHLKPNEPR